MTRGVRPLRIRAKIQHWLNPLHVYCRLTPLVGKRRALVLANRYESVYRRILAGTAGRARQTVRMAVK